MNAVFDPGFRVRDTEPVARSGYRRSRKGDPIATFGALAFVGLAGSAFAFMSPIFVKKQVEKPVVVMLMSLPVEPPPATAEPQPDKPVPPKVDLVTPPPQVALPPVPAAPVVQQVEVARPTPPSPPAPVATAPAPASRGPENVGDLSAKMISARPPRYPMDSRRAHEQGTVVLSVLLSTDGRVSDISVARSSGFVRLDRAALDAVRDWRWSPLMRDGNPVMVRGLVTIPFILEGPGGRDGDRRGRRHGRGRDDDADGGDDRQTT